ncbi:MAG: hypothetical protein J0L80_12315 [Chitinophagales bacterium]|nr:hypothetical protein [Chitinophagales bacterium]
MNQIFLIAADYLKGKSISLPIRRLLNLLFTISISSFLFEKYYGKYVWFNYYDYKAILNFFIKGNFFIPLSIFIAVYCGTYFVSLLIFNLINHFKTIKWTRKIIYYQVKKESVDDNIKALTRVSTLVSPMRLTKTLMIELYNNLKHELTPETFQKIESELIEPKKNLEATFHSVFRALIAITIYFSSIPQFGLGLYVIVCISLLSTLYILLLSYRFLDIIPALVHKFHNEAEKYLLAHTKVEN